MSLHIGIIQEFSLTTNQSVKEKNSKKPTNSNKIKRLKQAIDETPMSIGNWQFPNSTQYMFGNGFSIEMPIKPVFNQNRDNIIAYKPKKRLQSLIHFVPISTNGKKMSDSHNISDSEKLFTPFDLCLGILKFMKSFNKGDVPIPEETLLIIDSNMEVENHLSKYYGFYKDETKPELGLHISVSKLIEQKETIENNLLEQLEQKGLNLNDLVKRAKNARVEQEKNLKEIKHGLPKLSMNMDTYISLRNFEINKRKTKQASQPITLNPNLSKNGGPSVT